VVSLDAAVDARSGGVGACLAAIACPDGRASSVTSLNAAVGGNTGGGETDRWVAGLAGVLKGSEGDGSIVNGGDSIVRC
jgi:hypothetical protein